MITTEDIQKLSELSRMKIAPEEQESLRAEIESILGYVDQIKKAASGDVVVEVDGLHNVLREDGEPHSSGEFTEKILATAPAREGGYLKVKKIL